MDRRINRLVLAGPATSLEPPGQNQHLAGDIKRAYALLIREWLSHLDHLKASYPYLFSLAVRTNPFNPTASVELQ